MTPLIAHQPSNVAWPTAQWAVADIPRSVDTARLEILLETAFNPSNKDMLGETHALVIVQNGELIFEKYAGDNLPTDTYPSWSKAKSITHALIGILVRDGLIDVSAPADVPEWQAEGDPRKVITLDQLLRMSSGLKFTEDYVDTGVSDVIEMLFGKGQDDTAAFAANFPAEHAPDTAWNYASGTTNIVARCAARALGKSGDEFLGFMRDELFTPLGMTSALPKFDAAGTFIGSSFCYCTARDFAKFGLLYLRDGVWDGRRLLPEGWVDYARTPTPTPDTEDLGYGAHWWLGMCGPDSFSANGYQGQYTVIVPSLDLILVRHGNTPAELGENQRALIADIVDCFR